MRVVFDVTTCAKPRRGGISTYGTQLIHACRRVAPDNEYVFAVRSHRWLKRHLLDELLAGARPRLLLDGLQWMTLGRPVDAFHSIGVRLPAVGGFPRTFMLHDLNVFEFPELSTVEWAVTRQQRIRETVARADRVLCYSENGAATLQHYVDTPREKIRVVPLGVDTDTFRRAPDERLHEVLTRHELVDRPYLFMVGEASVRKNQEGLIDAFAAAGLPDEWVLVLGGPRGAERDRLRERAQLHGLSDDRVRLPGWIAEDELPALLSGAACYVCASLHEGFGLPVIEAQACGTAVLCADRGALPETLGDSGLLFDPGEPDDFCAALRRVTSDDALRARLATAGPARVRELFSWDRVAQQTLDVLSDAAASRS